MTQLVYSFPGNKSEEIHFSIRDFKGKEFIDLRVYTSMNGLEEKVPTGKGCQIPVAQFSELKKAVIALENLLGATR